MDINYYIGKKYNNLTILRFVDNKKHKHKLVEVKCDCGNENLMIKYLSSVIKGLVKSCGCARKGINKRYNKYNLEGDCGIGYDYKGKEFYFDLEDYDKIKDISWTVSVEDRVIGTLNNKNILFHKFITNTDKHTTIDHKDRNPSNNRKENLRIVTNSQNSKNTIGYGKMAKFGLKGVYWDEKHNIWCVKFKNNYITVYSKVFKNVTEAIEAKIEAEKIHFGEYRYAWEETIKWEELLEYEKELKTNSQLGG